MKFTLALLMATSAIAIRLTDLPRLDQIGAFDADGDGKIGEEEIMAAINESVKNGKISEEEAY